jgi:outer membrane protein OmpA-like peptidoglycan-associated protein
MKKKFIISLLCLFLCTSTFAGSHDGKSSYIGLGLGSYFNTRNSTNSPAIDGTLGHRFNKNIASQINIKYLANDQVTALAEGIWNFPNGTYFTPYINFGIGYTKLANTGFGLDIGTGFRYDLGSNVYISTDYRYIKSLDSHRSNRTLVTVALGMYFGTVENYDDQPVLRINDSQKNTRSIFVKEHLLEQHISECHQHRSVTIDKSVICYKLNSDKLIVYFDAKFNYDSYKLTSGTKIAIDNLISFVDQYNIQNITLNGYASQGKTSPFYNNYNRKLSVNRAMSVKSYLIHQHINPDYIKVVGYGYTHPLVPNNSKENCLINQRVEALVSKRLSN